MISLQYVVWLQRFTPIILLGLLGVIASCKDDDPAPPTTRTYRMGFQNSAPRFDNFDLILQSLELWTQRADAAMVTTEVPWDSIYAGKSMIKYVTNNYLGLVNYYRDKKFKLWIYIDPQNGLNRASDANFLVANGKSIAQDDVQKLYRRFVVVMDSLLHPDHLGLALETNLIRAASTPAIYAGVKKVANDAVADAAPGQRAVKRRQGRNRKQNSRAAAPGAIRVAPWFCWAMMVPLTAERCGWRHDE